VSEKRGSTWLCDEDTQQETGAGNLLDKQKEPGGGGAPDGEWIFFLLTQSQYLIIIRKNGAATIGKWIKVCTHGQRQEAL